MGITGWGNKITEITLFVEDLQRSKTFYQESFQVLIQYEDENCAVFDYGNTCINLLNQSNARELIDPAQFGRVEDGARFLCTIQVPDVDRVCNELEIRGVTLLNGPITRPWGRRTACFADPDGHIWEIAQVL
ncbi:MULTISPECIES: VOC family protein [unclassified Paenibacillus]|uniref:VOC family protein n=1 Tax=unclassified Paenibacillus TaxID=185978 RepID=UPI000CFAE8D8|nr:MULTISPECIES: VOC family protein [unclassified Paenibacillus]PRA07775.1 glyoxalase [Paenibacillus sp. MYb63]PRA51420.1 glyoxalase [Paenibacillus sp. MYb67]QZN74546.1 VOC family protein [Paenibacillus sp. DR312]